MRTTPGFALLVVGCLLPTALFQQVSDEASVTEEEDDSQDSVWEKQSCKKSSRGELCGSALYELQTHYEQKVEDLENANSALEQNRQHLHLQLRVQNVTLQRSEAKNAVFDQLVERLLLKSQQLYEDEQYEHALQFSQLALDSLIATLGPRHEHVLALKSKMADLLCVVGEHRQAKVLYTEVREVLLEDRGASDEATLQITAKLASVMNELELYIGSTLLRKEVFEKTMEVMMNLVKKHGRLHIETALALRELAVALKQGGKFDDALKMLRISYHLQLRRLPPDHPTVLGTLDDVADVLISLNRASDAVSIKFSQLNYRKKSLGNDHEDTVATRVELADTLEQVQRYAEAIAMLRSVVARRRETLGVTHVDTQTPMEKLAVNLTRLGRRQEALGILNTILQTKTQQYGVDHAETRRILDLIEEINAL